MKVSGFSVHRFSSILSTVSRFHSQGAIARGCSEDFYSLNVDCSYQINKYGRMGNIKEAESIFDRMPSRIRNTVTWTALLTAYANNGLLDKARKVFDEMPSRSVASWNAMITGYTRRSMNVDEAYELFSRMPERNARSYSAMITGFVRAGMLDEAEVFYHYIPSVWRDPFCSNALISGYVKMENLDKAIEVFTRMENKDVVAWSSIVDGYCKQGMIEDARKLFDTMPLKNFISWTSIIDGYMIYGSFKDGFELFMSMRRKAVEIGPVTLTVLSTACAKHSRHAEGYQIHGLVLRTGCHHDITLGNSIINMYVKLGCAVEAQKVFQEMDMKNLYSWNSLLASYIQADKVLEAYDIFCTMTERNIITLTTLIGGFSNRGDVAKCIHLFNMMPVKDDIAWTAVISGFENNGEFPQAIHWYISMIHSAVQPNAMTLSSVISASAGMSNLIQGTQIHTHALKMSMGTELSVQNALITMYSRCGAVSDAYQVFADIITPNIVSFNSMITGFAEHGSASESLNLFEKMQIERTEPNQITFLGVLSACKHNGLVEQAKIYFQQMKSIYGIEPGPNHYACMIDLLGRAGLFEQALDMIRLMPFEPNSGAWASLLSASRSHLRPDIAKIVAERLSKMEPDNPAPRLLLSNTYSALGENNSENVAENRGLRGIRNSPGYSLMMS
ncbi:hypothetical protein V2J09_015282 [Rumex salicifolius]